MKTNIHLQSWLRRAVLLLIVLTGSLPMMAQQEVIEGGEAFYIYQNDGHFDGFFYDQVHLPHHADGHRLRELSTA